MTRTSTPLSSVAENSSRWPSRGVAVEQAAYGGQEAEVGHVVGLVEHGDLDRAEVEQWPWPIRSSRRPGQATTMSTPRRRPLTCGFWPTPPKTVRVRQAGGRGQRREGRVDLADQLAGRRQDQRARAAGRRGAARRGEPGHQRQQERVGLAGAGAAAAEHVAAGERVGQRGGLDRESGSVMPCSASTRTNGSGTPSAWKEGVETRVETGDVDMR